MTRPNKIHWCYSVGRIICCCVPGCRGSLRSATVTASGHCCRNFLRWSGLKGAWATLSMPAQMGLALLCGMVIGFSLNYTLRADKEYLSAVTDWVQWPGDCFIRIMKAVDIPLIATNIVVGISGVTKFKLAGKLGILTGLSYLILALIASLTGVVSFLSLEPLWFSQYPDTAELKSSMALACMTGVNGTEQGLMALDARSQTFVCAPVGTEALAEAFGGEHGDKTSGMTSRYVFPVSIFGKKVLQMEEVPTDPAGVAHFIVDSATPSNAVRAFASDNVLGVITLAIAVGLSLTTVQPSGGQPRNVLADAILQLRFTLTKIAAVMMKWLGPVGAASLVAGAFASVSDPVRELANYGALFAALAIGYSVLLGIIVPMLFFLLAGGGNSFRYLWLFRSSFRALIRKRHVDDESLEQAIETAVEDGKVGGVTSGFVVSLGSDFALAGQGVTLPIFILFLIEVNGLWHSLSPGTIIIIGLVAVASVIGAAHFPNYGLILLLTIWAACFGGEGHKAPPQVGVLLALDWFFQLCIGLCNLACDFIVAKVVDELLQDGSVSPSQGSEVDGSSRDLDGGAGTQSFYVPNTSKDAFLSGDAPAAEEPQAMPSLSDDLSSLPKGSTQDLLKLMHRGSLIGAPIPIPVHATTLVAAGGSSLGGSGRVSFKALNVASPRPSMSGHGLWADPGPRASVTGHTIASSRPSMAGQVAGPGLPRASVTGHTSASSRPSMGGKRRSLAVQEGLQALALFGSCIRRLDLMEGNEDKLAAGVNAYTGLSDENADGSGSDSGDSGADTVRMGIVTSSKAEPPGVELVSVSNVDSPGVYRHKHHSSFYHAHPEPPPAPPAPPPVPAPAANVGRGVTVNPLRVALEEQRQQQQHQPPPPPPQVSHAQAHAQSKSRVTRGSIFRNHALAMIKPIKQGLADHLEQSSTSTPGAPGSARDHQPSSTSLQPAAPGTKDAATAASPSSPLRTPSVETLLKDMVMEMQRMKQEIDRLRTSSSTGTTITSTDSGRLAGPASSLSRQQPPSLEEENEEADDDEGDHK